MYRTDTVRRAAQGTGEHVPQAARSPAQSLRKAARFAWRTARNLVCAVPGGRSLLFPRRVLANDFGPDDADYAVQVFLHHYAQLTAAGFRRASDVLEAGPGRNIGTAILMWCVNQLRSPDAVSLTLWDVFPNARVDADQVRTASERLLKAASLPMLRRSLPDDQVEPLLGAIVRGTVMPGIHYRVEPIGALLRASTVRAYDLVYSHSVAECVWDIARFWRGLVALTRPGGWHSHRIDLADLGRRDTNYVEMLEWSAAAYWLSMRFVPGAINRWRAHEHLAFLHGHGLQLCSAERELREALPIARDRLNGRFRHMDERELRTTALDLVAVRSAEAVDARH